MPKEARLLDCQTIEQIGPFYCALQTIGDLTIITTVVSNASLAHPRTETGLQECTPLIAKH